jgi:hypothetical protein
MRLDGECRECAVEFVAGNPERGLRRGAIEREVEKQSCGA